MGVMNMMGCVKNTNKSIEHDTEVSMPKKKIKGTVVLMKKNVLDLNDFGSSFLDWVYEIFNKRVSIQLISSTHCDPSNGSDGKIGKAAFIEDWVKNKIKVAAGEESFSMTFEWDESMGVPGALMVKNHHHRQFYLKTVELEHVPGHGTIRFVCNSWVYPTHRYSYNRIFFANQRCKREPFTLAFWYEKPDSTYQPDESSNAHFGV